MLEHVAVEQDGRQVRGEIALDVDLVRLGRRAEEDHKILDEGGEIGRLQVQVRDAGEAEEIVGDIHQAPALFLQALDALLGTAFALVLRLLEIFAEQLQIEAEGAEVVFDFVDEPTRQLRQLGVLLVHLDCLPERCEEPRTE